MIVLYALCVIKTIFQNITLEFMSGASQARC